MIVDCINNCDSSHCIRKQIWYYGRRSITMTLYSDGRGHLMDGLVSVLVRGKYVFFTGEK